MSSFFNQTRRRFLRSALIGAAVIAALFIWLSAGGLEEEQKVEQEKTQRDAADSTNKPETLTHVARRAMLWLEYGSFDARVRLLDRSFAKDPAIATSAQKYVIIDIDNASFDGLQEQFGRWPWSRSVWTEVIRYVNRGQPKVIGVDIIFASDESAEVDGRFADVIRRSGKVVLGFSFSPTSMERVDDLVQQKLAVLSREGLPLPADAPGERRSTNMYAVGVPLKTLADAAVGIGSVNSIADVDGTIRRVPLQFVMDGNAFPTLASRMADLASGSPRSTFLNAGNHRARFHGREIYTDDLGRMLLLWRNRTLEEQRIPLWEVICSIYPANCPAEAHKYPIEFFKDKIVLLGASATGSYDAHTLPHGKQLPGFIVHMNAVENMLSGEAVRPAPDWFTPLAIILMTIAGVAVLAFTSSASVSAVAGAVCLLVYSLGSVLLFNTQHLALPMAAPLASFIITFLSASIIQYATTGRELRRTRGTLDRYMSPQLVNYVLENRDSINLAGEKKELTILFSDVRNFTTMTESSDPMELIATLNEYLEAMTEVIFKYDGITDKFIGDGIMAYWGAFTPGKNHAEIASLAALEMLERLEELNFVWKLQGRKELAIGIGLNTGIAVFGNVGSGRKKDLTVIGDAVNLAARLESQTKEEHVKLIVSEFTRARLGEGFAVRPLGGVKVKGKTIETGIFELISGPSDSDVNLQSKVVQSTD